MMCVIKSGYPQRIKRCNDLFAEPRLKEPRILRFVNDFTQLAEKLIELCNKPIAGNVSVSIMKIYLYIIIYFIIYLLLRATFLVK